MFTLVYKSEAIETLDTAEIGKLLFQARNHNNKNNITGCLLHHEGTFVQLLEGEENAVKSLFKKIKSDVRHRNVTVLNMEECALRIFGDWSMIYSDSTTNDMDDTIEKRNLFDKLFHSSNAPSAPGNSKLALWVEVNHLLNTEQSQVSG